MALILSYWKWKIIYNLLVLTNSFVQTFECRLVWVRAETMAINCLIMLFVFLKFVFVLKHYYQECVKYLKLYLFWRMLWKSIFLQRSQKNSKGMIFLLIKNQFMLENYFENIGVMTLKWFNNYVNNLMRKWELAL